MSEVIMFSDKLVLPLLATLGASLTVLFLQFNTKRVKETKQKIYTASYIMHQCYKIIFSELSILKATTAPHIKAIERILEGDSKLLRTMFLADEFDILKAPPSRITNLPDDYLLLLGYDNIELVSMYETMSYLDGNDVCRQDLNLCVRKNLKNMHAFMELKAEQQTDILHEYYDHLTTIEKSSKRKIFFILYRVAPAFSKYARAYKFLLYSKKSLNIEKEKINKVARDYREYIPDENFGRESMKGGIQKDIT